MRMVRTYISRWLLSFIIIFGASSWALAQNKGNGKKGKSPGKGAPQAKNQRWVKKGTDILYAFPTDTKVGIGLSNPSYPFEVAGESKFGDQVEIGSDLSLQGDLRLPNGIWTSDGSIGINTTDPQFSLDLVGTSQFDGESQFLQDVGFEGQAQFNDITSHNSRVNLPGAGIWNEDGRVGIGTSTPGYMLEVAGDSRFEEKAIFGADAEFTGVVTVNDHLEVAGTTILQDTAKLNSALNVSGTANFRDVTTFNNRVSFPQGILTSEGQLGIGTSTPENMLEVVGTSRFDGASEFIEEVTAQKKLFVEGASSFTAQAQFNSGVSITNSLDVGGNSTFNGNSEFSSELTVQGISRFGDEVRFTNGVWSSDGRLVIGGNIAAEDYKLQVKGKMDAGEIYLGGIPIKEAVALWEEQNSGDLVFTEGNVGIGTTDPDSEYKLSVNGKVRSKEVVVEADWADFVFDKDYELRSLPEVEEFIRIHGHLPEIPSEMQVQKEGIGVGAIQSKLLQKIEELTLYTIQQRKQIKQLKSLIGQQKHVLKELQRQIQEKK